jgi:hypothetical protein
MLMSTPQMVKLALRGLVREHTPLRSMILWV